MNKNLYYLIPMILVGGVVAYVTSKQNQKSIEESKKIISDSTKDFRELVSEDRMRIQEMTDRLNNGHEVTESELLNLLHRRSD